MLKPGSYSLSPTFSAEAMSRRDIKWSTGFICVGQVMCVFCKGPSVPASLLLILHAASTMGRATCWTPCRSCCSHMMSTSCCFPSLTGLCSLISKLKSCFSNFTISVMVYTNIEPTEDRDLFSFATKYSFYREHCLPEHQFKPCMNGVPI